MAACVPAFLLILSVVSIYPALADLPGTWEILIPDVGIASMHTAVTRFGTVVLLDRTDIGPTHKKLPRHNCRYDPNDPVLRYDCYAHSVLYYPPTNQIRPLKILTDTWCSSGQFLPDGTLLQTGGNLDGSRKIRKFYPCPPDEYCDWVELETPELKTHRWYATNQILPDGSVIIVGGRGKNSIEFYPPSKGPLQNFPFLAEAADSQMDNLYPYVHLLPDGNLFIFANTKSILYDYKHNKIIRYYAELEGGPRSYPSAGSSVMLPLEAGKEDFSVAEIVVCGGARYGAYIELNTDAPANGSCGRILATGADPAWAIEDMPFPRIMGDMVILPTGDVLILNGAQAGTQGFEHASKPCLNPVLYRPSEPAGLRFMTLTPSVVPRMYHSTANLLPDGRILVAGSNPHYFYKFDAKFPTELRLEAFSPEYLSPDRANLRPVIEEIPEKLRYGERFVVTVAVPLPVVGIVEVNFASAPFATHSFSQGQRLLKLGVSAAIPVGGVGVGPYRIEVTAPPNGRVAPPGYYMVFAVNQGVPSGARWAQLVL